MTLTGVAQGHRFSSMNAFTAILPDRADDVAAAFNVTVHLDPDGDAWIAESDAIPLATEAATLDALVERVWQIAPEIAELNGFTEARFRAPHSSPRLVAGPLYRRLAFRCSV
jgi:hypothetical protein